jgi:cytochrome c-type biogenesis protein CcmH
MYMQVVIFWAILAGLGGFAGLTLWRAGRQADAAEADGAADLRLYRAQLAEVDRDVARGVIGADEAGRLRTEIARRMLDADRRIGAADPRAARGAGLPVALTVTGALAVAVGTYLWLGAPGYPDLPRAERIARAADIAAARAPQDQAAGPPPALVDPADAADAALIRRLRAVVADRPDDLDGHRLLSEQESALGNIDAAAAAQARVVELLGDKAEARDHAILAHLMVTAADGYVSPEAEEQARAALALEPDNGTARFYIGLAAAQVGRPDVAFDAWRTLYEDSPAEAPWMPLIRGRIGMLARAAGVDYVPPDEGRGPSAEDVAAAEEMTPDERQAMIGGMVEGLAARLATEGGPAADWAQLIRALGVLGQTDRARAIRSEAEDVFAASPDDLAIIAAAARDAGLDG